MSLHWRKGTIEGCFRLSAIGIDLEMHFLYLGPVMTVALHLQALP